MILPNRGREGLQKVKSISAKWTKPLITITVPVNDMAWDVTILMRANHFESHWTFWAQMALTSLVDTFQGPKQS